MERVKIIDHFNSAKLLPLIFVAPYGLDDTNTNIITETAATFGKGFAVINQGWKKGDEVDYYKDIADCNYLPHLYEEVVRDEFFDPLLRFKARILKKHDKVFIFYIQSLGDHIYSTINDPLLGMILGYGYHRDKPSFSCEDWIARQFCYHFSKNLTFSTYLGHYHYQGWTSHSLNQYFRLFDYDHRVQSMQLFITKKLRSSEKKSQETGEDIALAAHYIANNNVGYWITPYDFNVKIA